MRKPPTQSMQEKLLQRCLHALCALPEKEALPCAQQALHKRILEVEDPALWDEDAFDLDTYHALLASLREADKQNSNAARMRQRLHEMTPAKVAGALLYI